MPVNDHDDQSVKSPEGNQESVTPRVRWRRYLTRRNALRGTILIAVAIVALLLLAVVSYRIGVVDRYLVGQIKDDLAKYGVRAEIKSFHASMPPSTVELRGFELFDAATGQKLAKIDSATVGIRIQDLYAFNLSRHVDLKDLKIDGLEVWVDFDDQGRSNLRNLHLPPTETNKRIVFAYSSAHVELINSLIHYGDVQHSLSGEARNLHATVDPEDPNAPIETAMFKVVFGVSNSTFLYDGRPVNNIDIDLKARAGRARADVEELVLRSPIAEARLQGTMDDWSALRYQLDITSTVDITQLSDLLQTGTAMRGAGNFAGTVSGEGDKYKVQGTIKSDALAAAGVRLEGLNITAAGSGQDKSYDINGKAVAALLATGDFRLNSVQLTGGVMGTGSDFRWVGELRAAAARTSGAATIIGLILHDARAEMNDGVLTASASLVTANGLTASGARANGIRISNLRLRNEDKAATGSIASAKVSEVDASGARVKDIAANNIDFTAIPAGTGVNIKEVILGGMTFPGGEIDSFNIAGVRLSVRDGRIEGSTADINPGTIKLDNGQLENVKLARPVFVVEPAGSYRASADLSIGGGVLAEMNMGQVRAALVATSSQVQLNDFSADFFGGRATGTVTIGLTKSTTSHVVAAFTDLDVAAPVTVFAKVALPLAGKASGKIDVTFPATDFARASGNISTQFTAEAVEARGDRTPISGEVSVRANNGLFQIDRVDLQTAASHLKATGQFSINGDSDLQVDFNSTDAAEIQRLAMAWVDVEEQMNDYGLGLAGQMAFIGSVRGKLSSPDIDGRFSLGSLLVNGNDLGALTAAVVATEAEIRVTEGKLAERDGGGVQFSVNAPRTGKDNISIDATLDRANARTLLAVLPKSGSMPAVKVEDTESDVSGTIKISGIPSAMVGSADLRLGAGRISGEPFESIVARATFNGPNVNLENVDAHFSAGHVTAKGTFNTETKFGDLDLTGQAIQLSRIATLSGKPALKTLTGVVDATAHISGNFLDKEFSSYQITFDAQGKDPSLQGHSIGALSLVGRTENKQLNVTFTTGVLGRPQTVNARVDLAGEQLPATIEATLNAADLTRLLALAFPEATVKLSGVATGTIKASGNLLDDDGYFSLEGLRGAADFSELSFRVEDIALAAVAPFTVRLTANEVIFDHAQLTGAGTNIVIDGAIAVAEGGKETLGVDGRLNLRVLNGLSPDLFLSGTSDIAMRVSGSHAQPRVNGTASLSGASVAVLVGNDRWQVSNIKSVLRFSADQAQIESFAGTLGGGHVTASGGALLDGFTVSQFLLNLRGDNVTAPFPQDFTSTFDAEVEIKGNAREQLITGLVNLHRTEYTKDIELADLINRRRQESIEEGGEIALVHTARFADLRVEGRNALVVRNNLADLTGSVSLQIDGPVKDPVIAGRITAANGTLNFRNDRYDITRAFMDLPPRRGADPLLNIEGESEIRGYRVIVNLTGPLSQPQATVRSEPALPQADVVSLITTGTLSSGDPSTSTQTGLGTATSLLTDALINAPAQRATNKLFGLSRFEINPVIGGRATSPGARLTLGKRISKELSVTYSTNVTSDPNQILAVEYRVSDRLSFVALYEQASTQQLSSRNNSFSFEIRFRKRF